MSALFSDLQQAVADRLEAHLGDAGGPRGLVPLLEIKGDLVTQIQQRLAKVGVGIAVLTPEIRRMEGGGDNQVELRVSVGIAEKPIVNLSSHGSGVPAIDIVSAVLGSLHGWQPESEQWSALVFEGLELVNVGEYVEYAMEYSTSTYLQFES